MPARPSRRILAKALAVRTRSKLRPMTMDGTPTLVAMIFVLGGVVLVGLSLAWARRLFPTVFKGRPRASFLKLTHYRRGP
jgi:hypothetical protein